MTEENGEIEVFGAEKYFKRKVVETPRASTKYQLEYGTPSISSASTWNNQNALLKKDSEKSIKDKVHAKSVLSRLGLKCSCSDKNSVDISDNAGEISFNNKTSNYGAVHEKATPKKEFNLGLDDDISIKLRKASSEFFINKDLYFQKQENLSVGLNSEMNSSPSNSRNHLVKMQFPLDEEKIPRKSLEIFPSKIEEIVDTNDDEDDARSDASSDLFEIESLKEKFSSNFLNKRTSDSASTCYAPSEASVEWSVVTASAAVMSDCEDQMSEFTVRSPIKITREVPTRRPGILLGCKSHKAVRVAGDTFITYEKQSLSPKIGNRNKNNVISQVARFPGETDVSVSERHV